MKCPVAFGARSPNIDSSSCAEICAWCAVRLKALQPTVEISHVFSLSSPLEERVGERRPSLFVRLL